MNEIAEFLDEFEGPGAGIWGTVVAKTVPELEEFQDLSSMTLAGIYILFIGNRIMYVGQTQFVGKRIAQHVDGYRAGYKSLKNKVRFDRVIFWPCKSEAKRVSIEAALIRKYNPPYNKKGKEPRPDNVKPLSEIMKVGKQPELKVVGNVVMGIAFGRRI